MSADAVKMLRDAHDSVRFVRDRNMPQAEPLDDLDWQNINAAGAALGALVDVFPVTPIPATSSLPGPAVRVGMSHTPSQIYSPAGVATALRQIHHRGQLASGDLDVIHAAIRLIEGGAK